MFLRRDLESTLARFSKFPVVAILGPRQSGKTTLAQNFFANHLYLNLEDPEMREMAYSDPKGLLRKYENEHGIILDEFQNAPGILSPIQVEVDAKKRPGYFVLTGSQNFLINEKITQSLAGRVGILTLLPFSIKECKENGVLPDQIEKVMLNGGYPRIYAENFTPDELYPSYIHTYLERDVRQLINVVNFRAFQKFIKLCAGRVGQLLNYADLAAGSGVSEKTIQEWIAILEVSYIIFLLRPHWNNFNKRVSKTPKLYFYDTGVACSLLEITSTKDLMLSPFYGHLFECLILSDLHKRYYNAGKQPPLYFWRDKNGRIEVDCLVDRGSKFIPIEVKSGETFDRHYFDSLNEWNAIAQANPADSYVVYGGASEFAGENGNLVSWLNLDTIDIER